MRYLCFYNVGSSLEYILHKMILVRILQHFVTVETRSPSKLILAIFISIIADNERIPTILVMRSYLKMSMLLETMVEI